MKKPLRAFVLAGIMMLSAMLPAHAFTMHVVPNGDDHWSGISP